MGRQPGNSKVDSHKTERFLRQITMLMRLQRIKARMATQSSEQQRSVHHSHRAFPSTRDRQRSATSASSSQQRSAEALPLPSLSLSSVLQRTSVVLHPDRQQRSEVSSKRSLRFSHRRRQSEQLRRQLERQAGSERQPVARVRVVAVVVVPHQSGSRQSSGSARSTRRRMRRTLARELRMSAGRPHVLNLVRRLLGRVESMAAGPQEELDANGGRIFVSQAQNEQTPDKGNQGGEGDDQKTG